MPLSLDRIADADGRFAILAMDQRGTLRKMLETAGRTAADEDLRQFKIDVVSALSPNSTGVLLDVEYGVDAVRAAGALAETTGLLISAERSPGSTWNGEARVEFDPDRGPAWVRANGGVALKFLLRWRPDRQPTPDGPDLAAEALAAVAAVVDACRREGMPSVIEPLVATGPGEAPFDAARKRQAIVRSAELLAELGPDLLKLEWPGDGNGCRELSDAVGSVAWTLLSAGVAYEVFVDQVATAMDAGASGFIAGRAIWGEAVGLEPSARREFLAGTASERLRLLRAGVVGHGRSWREVATG
jgi:tagatose-1,6-bisphosphate aldolase